METSKFKKIYLLINIPLMVTFFILLIAPYLITNEGIEIYYLGIICRVTLGVWSIFNGIWNACTDYYSILKTSRFQKNKITPKWAWWVLFIIGVGCIMTAYMGYGYNGVSKPM